MKKVALLFSSVLLLFLAGCGVTENAVSDIPDSSEVEPTAPESTPSLLDESAFFLFPYDDMSVYEAGLVSGQETVFEELSGLTVYRIQMTVENNLYQLSGRQHVRYTNMESEALDTVYFRLYANLFGGSITVADVTMDGEPVDSKLELEESALRIDLPAPLQPGEVTEIAMQFDLELPREMGGNYGLFSSYDERMLLHVSYPVIPVYDDEGWNVEIPPEYGDVSFFDMALYLVQVEAPAGLSWVTTGVEIAAAREDSGDVLVFAAGPARDFYMAASPRFEVLAQQVGETTVRSFAFDGRETGSEAALNVAANAIASYSERFGPYPYTEFDIVGAPMEAWGMEYPGATAISDTLYDPEVYYGNTPALTYLEGTVAHEVAHQWFFNLVGTDQVDEPWMDEAIVQYATGLYFLDQYGEEGYDGFQASWYDRWNRLDRADIPIGGPVSDYPGASYSAIIYGRGPLFIEALAREMGQATFDEFIRTYSELNRWGTAYPDELQMIAEDVCACDLSALFAEWVE